MSNSKAFLCLELADEAYSEAQSAHQPDNVVQKAKTLFQAACDSYREHLALEKELVSLKGMKSRIA